MLKAAGVAAEKQKETDYRSSRGSQKGDQENPSALLFPGLAFQLLLPALLFFQSSRLCLLLLQLLLFINAALHGLIIRDQLNLLTADRADNLIILHRCAAL